MCTRRICNKNEKPVLEGFTKDLAYHLQPGMSLLYPSCVSKNFPLILGTSCLTSSLPTQSRHIIVFFECLTWLNPGNGKCSITALSVQWTWKKFEIEKTTIATFRYIELENAIYPWCDVEGASYLKKVTTSTSWIFRCVIDVCSVLAGAWSEICLCLTIIGNTSVLLCFKRIGFPHIVPSQTHPLGGGVPAEYPWKRLLSLVRQGLLYFSLSSQSYNTNMDGLNDVQWNVCRRGEVSQPCLMCPPH